MRILLLSALLLSTSRANVSRRLVPQGYEDDNFDECETQTAMCVQDGSGTCPACMGEANVAASKALEGISDNEKECEKVVSAFRNSLESVWGCDEVVAYMAWKQCFLTSVADGCEYSAAPRVAGAVAAAAAAVAALSLSLALLL